MRRLLFLVTIGACDQGAPPVDSVAPGDITDLSVEQITETSVTLGWTALGDDGARGFAADYDLLYAAGTEVSEESGTVVDYLVPSPTAGTHISWTSPVLLEDTLYTFAVRAHDEQANHGAYATVQVATLDATAPEPVTELHAEDARTGNTLNVSWVPPPTPDLTNLVLRYGIDGTDVVGSIVMLLDKAATNTQLTGLTDGALYLIELTARDDEDNDSQVAQVPATPSDQTAPASVQTFGVGFDGPSLRLGWENPIDPDRVAVQIRYAEATCPVGGEGTPFLQTTDVSGAFTDLPMEGLIPEVNTDYCFTAIAIDEVPNLSDPAIVWLCVGGVPGTTSLVCPR